VASPAPRSIQSGPFGSALLHSEFQDTGVLAIGIDNVLDGTFSPGSQHRISPEKFEALEKFEARPFDVLITVMATVGRCCVVPSDIERSIITKHVYRISPNVLLMDPYFLMFALSGGIEVRRQLFGEIRGQTRPGINGEILRRLCAPLPPLAEQQEIAQRVERLMSQKEMVAARVERAAARVEQTAQAVLAKAFRGELVPQDPADEPAAATMERLQSAELPGAARAGRRRQ
jgi:type I restriction enzyme S subunit